MKPCLCYKVHFIILIFLIFTSQIVSGGVDKTIILWDVVKAQPLRRLRGHAGKVTSVLFNEESTAVISGSYDNTVMCWDVKSRQNTPVQVSFI